MAGLLRRPALDWARGACPVSISRGTGRRRHALRGATPIPLGHSFRQHQRRQQRRKRRRCCPPSTANSTPPYQQNRRIQSPERRSRRTAIPDPTAPSRLVKRFFAATPGRITPTRPQSSLGCPPSRARTSRQTRLPSPGLRSVPPPSAGLRERGPDDAAQGPTGPWRSALTLATISCTLCVFLCKHLSTKQLPFHNPRPPPSSPSPSLRGERAVLRHPLPFHPLRSPRLRVSTVNRPSLRTFGHTSSSSARTNFFRANLRIPPAALS